MFSGCRKDNLTIDIAQKETVVLPEHFPPPFYSNDLNAFSATRINLGKMLFFDPVLSVDSTISCGSCHNKLFAYSDRGSSLSTGINQQIGIRNSPPIFNVLWNKSFMWDGGVNHLEFMPLAPIENELEMGEKIKHVIAKLNRIPEYRNQFKQAYGIDSITDKYFLFAMAQFLGSLISANSAYDSVQLGLKPFSVTEQSGYDLYKQKCATCHAEPLFTDYSFRNNGLANTSDSGRMRITLLPEDRNKFKVPSLRNLDYSFPYMHDGRFKTLPEVLDHYSENIISSPTLDPELKPMYFSETEKEQLLAFLKTLNDPGFAGRLNP